MREIKFKWPFKRNALTEVYNDCSQKIEAKEINYNQIYSPLVAIKNLLSNNKFNHVLTEMQLLDEEIYRSHPKYPYYGYERVRFADKSILRSVPNSKVSIPEEMRLSYKGKMKILDTNLPIGVNLNDYFIRKSVLNEPIKVEVTSVEEIIGNEVLKNENGISNIYSGVVKAEMHISNFEEEILVKVEDISERINTIIDYLPLKRTDYNYEENYIEVSNCFDLDSDIIVSLRTPLDKIINGTIDTNDNLKMNVCIRKEKESNLSINILCARWMYGLCNANIIRFTDLKTRMPMIEIAKFSFTDIEREDLLVMIEALEKLSQIELKYGISFEVGEINNSALDKINLLVDAVEEIKNDIKVNKLSVGFDKDELLRLYESESNFFDKNIRFSFEDAEHSILELWGYRFSLKRVVYLDDIQLSREDVESALKNSNQRIELKFHTGSTGKVSECIVDFSKL